MQKLWTQVLIVIAITLAVYHTTPQAGFIPIDDASLTYENPLVRSVTPETIKGVFSTYDPELYVPLTLISYQADYYLGNGAPAVFHITNLLLHALNAVLVLLLVRLWTTSTWIPFLTALLFALHPINTEAVMWISGRKDVLSATFFLGSLLSYCYYRKANTRLPYYASLLLFLCALLSKVVTATLPLVFIIVDDFMNLKNDRQQQLRKYPFYLLALFFVFVGMLGKSLTIYFLSYGETILLAGKSAAFYVQKLLLPVGLIPLYQQELPIEPLSMEFMAPFAVLALLYLIAIASRQFGKLMSFGILWFGITLLPSLASFSRGVSWSIFYASDRYAYLPSIGILLLISFGLTKLATKKQVATVATTLVIVLSLLSVRQSRYWLTGESLFSYTVHTAPQTHLAHALLGFEDLNNNHYNDAIAHLSRSVELEPNYPEARAHLGLAIMKNGNINGGMAEITQTIAADPTYLPAFVYQAYGYLLQGKADQAKQVLTFLLGQDPDNEDALKLMKSIQ